MPTARKSVRVPPNFCARSPAWAKTWGARGLSSKATRIFLMGAPDTGVSPTPMSSNVGRGGGRDALCPVRCSVEQSRLEERHPRVRLHVHRQESAAVVPVTPADVVPFGF